MEQAVFIKQKLDELMEALGPERVDADPGALAEFARRLLLRGSTDFLERREVSETVDDVVRLFRLVQDTEPGEIAVRVRPLSGLPARTAVETVMPDCPFIVSTLREYVHACGLDIPSLLHPVLVLEREAGGRIVEIRDRSAEGPRTSVVLLVADGAVEEADREEMERAIRYRLGQVRRVTSDFTPMIERLTEIQQELERKKEEVEWRASEFEEIQDLLRWLEDGGFVFLGYRGYDIGPDEEGRTWIRVVPGTGLGILRDEESSRYAEPRPVDDMPPDLKARVLGGPLLIVSKTNAESPVQRSARMDYIGIKKLAPDGTVVGEHRLLGLFTAKAYQQDASTIPILRRKLREILEREGAPKGSHDYHLIVQTFNSMPKEELFLSSVGELAGVINTVMETEGADEVRVSARPDALARGVNVMVILPKHRFSGEVRQKIQEALVERYRGTLLNYHLALGEGDQARLHFYIATDVDELGEVDVAELEGRVRESVRSWDERLSDALERAHEPARAHHLADRHHSDFSPEYKATMDVATAVEDIDRLESLESTGVQQVVLEAAPGDRPHGSRLKIFAPRGMFVLSDIMPTLENLGFRVVEADRYDVSPDGSAASTIHVFQVELPPAWGVDLAEAEPRVAAALRAVQGGLAEDDRLNQLVLSAGLDWEQVAVLRAYTSYAFRTGAVASRYGAQRPLVEQPALSRLLLEIFEARFEPGLEGDRESKVRRLGAAFTEALRGVRGIEDDRTFRRLLNLVRSTVRTNYFQRRFREEGALLALKFDCRDVEVMPRPRPKYECYLNGPGTEAAHLRMDDVARGGIRWSDRSEDFRVEVLGLVKTQQVKNSVIVPAGAKGAFIVKRTAGETDPRAAAVESYQAFIRGLLDVADNVVDGEVRHPRETVIRDGPDPYLVVAADKGTASLSDTANALAAEREFWLGDAFASGGSRGYDHKELGITARGAWECVKRHFRELGLDIQSEPFTVIGVGDMSGDVFGNGMLLSRRIRLVAAFDHRHVFVDPDPDPEASWEERKRLFELPTSTWMDYDTDVLSEGGGIWDRTAKQVDLSPRAREILGIPDEVEELNADALIRSILRAPADLLWNGGIGTYVKASFEPHGEVGDPGNDTVRVDADDLLVRVVGEGGNLGFTQLARIEYALSGGRLNTDALDNSAGVDMSDHEVNLKILLDAAVRRGDLTEERRHALLREVEDEVAEAVLANNYGQSLAVSLDERRARETPAEFRDALVFLERDGLLDRQLEFLPTTEELLDRQEEGSTLTRPELAVLLAYAKMHLKRSIQGSALTQDPAMEDLLRAYFPPAAVEAVGRERLREHRLRSHIVATALTNRFLDRMGATAHMELVRETGRPPEDVARMWHVADRIGEADLLHGAMRELDGRVAAGVLLQWRLEMSGVLERATLWLLANCEPGPPVREVLSAFVDPVRELRDALPELLTEERAAVLESRRSLNETDGLDPGAAARLATFGYLDELLPVAQLAGRTGLPARVVGAAYFGLSRELDFPWLRERLAALPTEELWLQRAAKTLALRLETARARITERVLEDVRDPEDVDLALRRFRDENRGDLERVREVMEDVRVGPADLAALVVAVHAVDVPGLVGGSP